MPASAVDEVYSHRVMCVNPGACTLYPTFFYTNSPMLLYFHIVIRGPKRPLLPEPAGLPDTDQVGLLACLELEKGCSLAYSFAVGHKGIKYIEIRVPIPY